MKTFVVRFVVSVWILACSGLASAQPDPQRPRPQPAQPPGRPPFDRPDFDGPPPGPPDDFPPFGPNGPRPGFGGRDGRNPGGGPPSGVQERRKLVALFDRNADKRLDAVERQTARNFLQKERAEGREPRRPGPPRMRTENSGPTRPGPKVSPPDVKTFPNASLYDMGTLRTFFLEFENTDWEKELSDFYHTDVEVPARLTVDGKSYPDVGVHFRGASSYFTVNEGRKRSLNLSLDFAHEDQRLYGYARWTCSIPTVIPRFSAPPSTSTSRANISRPPGQLCASRHQRRELGRYINTQQFNKDFLKDFFETTDGARWKVPGSPRGDGGLAYLGTNFADYKKRYEIKSKDDSKSWERLIELCRVLHQTPPAQLEKALQPLLDIDGALKFLALENVFINNDGYWTRASDYYLYLDTKGRFHLIPHDANETFRPPEGPGMSGGGRVNGVELSPQAGGEDARKPLLNKLLEAPDLAKRYLGYVRQIATEWLDWNKLGPLAHEWQALIADDVKTDTHQLYSYAAFQDAVEKDTANEEGRRGPRTVMSLKSFVEKRRAFLLQKIEAKAKP
jgi:hypothetical protein